MNGADPLVRIGNWEDRLKVLARNALSNWKCRCFESCDSTMECARELIADLQPGDAGLILARQQLQGRGRQGRSWLSPEQGFFATYVFRAEGDLASVSSYTLSAGAIICGVLRDLGYDVGLKWPNDILSSSSAKLCGILSELVSRPSGHFILVGIGINIAGEPDNSQYPATSLQSLTGRSIDPVDIAISLSNSLLKGWQDFQQRGFSAFREDWLKLALFLGRRIVLNTGEERLSGIYRGIGDSGSLLLECGPKGVREIVSAHIESIEAEDLR
jgi:BirA family biotin operon repressor/biotin-[acetyl-CoA-carboxylase] ligase